MNTTFPYKFRVYSPPVHHGEKAKNSTKIIIEHTDGSIWLFNQQQINELKEVINKVNG